MRESLINRLRLRRQRGPRSPRLPRPSPRAAGDGSPPLICRMIFDELCVLANGDVVCSCGDPAGRRVYGNVFRHRLEEVYDGAMYRQMRRWQLASRPDSWCPVIGARCGGRISRASAMDQPTGRTVKVLQLEAVSHCNLACPGCPVTRFEEDPAYRRNRSGMLPLEVMLEVVDQLPDLEKILFYNFGEPFLHPQAMTFLRRVRRRRPQVQIHASTNGLPLAPAKVQALGREALVDRMVFSIDGARPESYARYRVGGSLERALGNLRALAEACRQAGTAGRVEVVWQYILFTWNDSDGEIAEARRRAGEMGVPLHWVVTHTPGASERFRDGSPALARLLSQERSYDAMTCDLRMQEMWQAGGRARGRYDAALSAPLERLRGAPGETVALPVTVENRSGAAWNGLPLRLGLLLRSATGRRLEELPGFLLPPGSGAPGRPVELPATVTLPAESGEYQLLVDLVEERVCWFSERGSQPLVLPLVVGEG